MSTGLLKNKWIYGLLGIPVVSAILALIYHDFAFKAGVAGAGIILLMILYSGKLKEARDVWMIMIAFLFSIGGDWFLSNRHGDISMFVAGIGLFFLAHIGYLSYGLMNGRLNRAFTFILLAAYLLFFFLKLYPSIGDRVLLFAALVYTLISCFSLGAAAGIRGNAVDKWVYFFGILMGLFSDTIIAFREFTEYGDLGFLILPTYYLAQISVTLSLMMKRMNVKKLL
jgi:uncharacterized membrane protein YhhN